MPAFLSFRWLRLLLVLSVVGGVLSGCGMFKRKDPRTDPAPLTEYSAGISTSVAWTVPVGSGSGYGFAPIEHEGAVYAATPSGAVVKVATGTGSIGWRTDTGKRLSAGVGSDGNTTAVAAEDGTVIALNASGQEKWTARAASNVAVPPVVGEGVVVVRSGDYRIQAFDASDGDLRWSVQRPGPALALSTSMQMMMLDGMVITGMPNGKLMAIDVESGSVQWEGTVGMAQGPTDLERISDVVGKPQLQGSYLCGVTYQSRMACFDIARGGDTVWSQRFSSSTGMTTDAAHAYAPNPRSVVYAFDLEDGHQVWKQEALRNRRLATPAVVEQAVAVADFEGYVHFLGRADGRLLGRISIGGGRVLSPLLATEQGVIVQAGNGSLHRISLR